MKFRAWLGNWVTRRHWRQFAEQEPYWAILTHPDNVVSRLDQEAFFASGRATVADHLKWVREQGAGPTGPALDFGCGVGRLTLALREYFDAVTGIDVAPGMITLAQQTAAGRAGVTFLLNARPDLRDLDSRHFGFVYSYLVLQHVPPATARGFLAELIRVCRPGGYLLFQLPSENRRFRPKSRRERCRRAFWRAVNRWMVFHPAMEVHAIAASGIEKLLKTHGCRLIARRPDTSAGPEHPGLLYLAQKI